MPAGYLPSDAIDGVVTHLAATYHTLTQLITLQEPSIEQRTIHGIKIANGSSPSRRGVLLIGGVHARELVNPDLLVSFTTKLLQAYTTGTGVAFGSVSYSKDVVALIIDNLDVFVVPLVNPDGRTFVQNPAGDPMWRKNRNPNPGQPCAGVDLNRNYDFLWSSGIGTSTSPCSDTFKGIGAFSEPETRNVRHLLDAQPNIMCLADIHSYSELVLFPWGDDDNQSATPSMNFRNAAFDGQRGIASSGYGEYVAADDLAWFTAAANGVRDTIKQVRGRTYTAEQGMRLYPTSATVHDWAYSRHFVKATQRKVMAFTIETAREFQPPYAEASQVIDEVSAGLMSLLLSALCAAEGVLSGTTAVVHLNDLRTLRDDVLMPSPAGRMLAGLFDTHGAEVLQAVGAGLVKRPAVAKLLNAWAKSASKHGGLGVAPVPGKVVDDALAMLSGLADGASPAFRRSLGRLQRDAEEFRDRSVPDALAAITKRRRLG